jgi:hypothetical protein
MTYSTRDLLYQAGREVVLAFLDLNDIPHPAILRFTEVAKARRSVREHLTNGKKLHQTEDLGGYYRGHIFVNVPGTYLDGKYSAPEVLAHEVGHYILHAYEIQMPVWRGILRDCSWREYIDEEAEYTAEESFAETMRMFILQPRELRRRWPERWRVFTYDLELRPFPALMRRV